MKKTILLLAFFSFQFSIYSQIHRCGDVLHKEYLKNNFKEIYDNIIEPKDVSAQRNNTVHRIPVVVHIVHNGNDENLTEAIINNQIDILNKDFRRQNEDAYNTREVFMAVAGDAMIEFYLAQQDPNGNATTGITRTKTQKVSFLDLDIFLFLQAALECDVDFSDPASIEAAQECLDKFFEEKGLNFDNIFSSLDNIKSTSKGGIDPWNPKKYLNIWVGDLSIDLLGQKIPFVLGFAYPPVGAPLFPEELLPEGYEKNDGVVIHYQVFGSNNPAIGTLTTNNKGRTCTHEVGHYLGLRHIWGDGDCTMDDGISDTKCGSRFTIRRAHNLCCFA